MRFDRTRPAALLVAGLAALLATMAGCPSANDVAGEDDADNATAADGGAASTVPGAGNPGGFLYVLQPDAVGDDALSKAAFKWLVLEPSREGNATSEFSQAELDAIRNGSGCGSKTILAYLSIGEAEDYRDYWDTGWVAGDEGPPIAGVAPSWLGPSNPRWGGNYKVRYWEPGWQAVILGTADGAASTPLDRIIDAGFDGVYLDIVDGFEFWSDPDEGYAELSRDEARRRMIEWVIEIGDYAHKVRGVASFRVFPQNAEAIIYNDEGELDELSEAYFAAIDGIGIEDLFYSDTDNQDESEVEFRVATLNEFRDRAKTVLVTDYVVSRTVTVAGSATRVADFYQRALDAGFVPYAAIAEGDLDEIVMLEAVSWPVSQPPACVE